MRLLYHSRHRKPEVEVALGIEYRSFDDLLAEGVDRVLAFFREKLLSPS